MQERHRAGEKRRILGWDRGEKQQQNKQQQFEASKGTATIRGRKQVRGGTSDATTSSSLMMSCYPKKRPYLLFENNTGHRDLPTDGRTDGRTRLLIEMRSDI